MSCSTLVTMRCCSASGGRGSKKSSIFLKTKFLFHIQAVPFSDCSLINGEFIQFSKNNQYILSLGNLINATLTNILNSLSISIILAIHVVQTLVNKISQYSGLHLCFNFRCSNSPINLVFSKLMKP